MRCGIYARMSTNQHSVDSPADRIPPRGGPLTYGAGRELSAWSP